MRARVVLNLVLLMLLLGLLLIAIRQPGIHVSEPDAKLVTSIKPDQVTRIVIKRPRLPAVELERSADNWQLVKPIAIAANTIKVQKLLRLLDSKVRSSQAAAAVNLQEFGLAAPGITIRFNELEIGFGDVNSVTSMRYILVDKRIYAVIDTVYPDLTADAVTFASLRLIPDGKIPTAIGFGHQVLKREGAKWTLIPAVAGTTGDMLTGIAEAWREAQAFAVKSLADATADESVTIDFEEGPGRVFKVRSRKPELVLERSDLGLAYHLFADQAARLFPPTAHATDTAGASTAVAPIVEPTVSPVSPSPSLPRPQHTEQGR